MGQRRVFACFWNGQADSRENLGPGKSVRRVSGRSGPQAEILTEEVMKTSAIEGETLKRDSVRSSVARHLGLSRAGLPKADQHVDGLVEVCWMQRKITINR